MRVRKGNFTYDIEPVEDSSPDTATQYRVSLARTDTGELLFERTVATLQEAEALGELEMAKANCIQPHRAA